MPMINATLIHKCLYLTSPKRKTTKGDEYWLDDVWHVERSSCTIDPASLNYNVREKVEATELGDRFQITQIDIVDQMACDVEYIRR